MKKAIVILFVLAICGLFACTTSPDAEEKATQDEMDKVDELRESDEARMDSMRRELGVD